MLKVIDQGADDTTNAVSIRRFFARTAGVRTTTAHRGSDASSRPATASPRQPLREDQIIVYQVPQPEPLYRAGTEPGRDAPDACAGRIRPDAREAL